MGEIFQHYTCELTPKCQNFNSNCSSEVKRPSNVVRGVPVYYCPLQDGQICSCGCAAHQPVHVPAGQRLDPARCKGEPVIYPQYTANLCIQKLFCLVSNSHEGIQYITSGVHNTARGVCSAACHLQQGPYTTRRRSFGFNDILQTAVNCNYITIDN